MKPLSIEEINTYSNLPEKVDSMWIHPSNPYFKRLLHTARLAHKMKESLEFYGNEENWGHNSVEYSTAHDGGICANKALKLWNEEE